MDSSSQKKAITIKVSLENLLTSSQRKPNLIKSDRGKEFFNNFFQKFLRNINFNNFKHYSRKTHLGVVFAERFIRTIRDLLKRPVFEKVDSNWIETYFTYNNETVLYWKTFID